MKTHVWEWSSIVCMNFPNKSKSNFANKSMNTSKQKNNYWFHEIEEPRLINFGPINFFNFLKNDTKKNKALIKKIHFVFMFYFVYPILLLSTFIPKNRRPPSAELVNR